MKLLQQTIEKIEGLDQEMVVKARTRVDSLIKPPNSLGKLEDLAIQFWGLQESFILRLIRKQLL